MSASYRASQLLAVAIFFVLVYAFLLMLED